MAWISDEPKDMAPIHAKQSHLAMLAGCPVYNFPMSDLRDQWATLKCHELSDARFNRVSAFVEQHISAVVSHERDVWKVVRRNQATSAVAHPKGPPSDTNGFSVGVFVAWSSNEDSPREVMSTNMLGSFKTPCSMHCRALGGLHL